MYVFMTLIINNSIVFYVWPALLQQFPFYVIGDANNSTLSPMENHHVIENNDKADLMTMSTPPHLLSAALGAGLEEGENKTKRIHNNYRSKFFCQKFSHSLVHYLFEHLYSIFILWDHSLVGWCHNRMKFCKFCKFYCTLQFCFNFQNYQWP